MTQEATFVSDRERFEKEWLHWAPPKDALGYYVSDRLEAQYSIWSSMMLIVDYQSAIIKELRDALSKAESLGK